MTAAGPIIMMLICKCKKDGQEKVVVNIPWLNQSCFIWKPQKRLVRYIQPMDFHEVLVSPWQSYQDMQLPILDGAEYRQIVESYRLYDWHFFLWESQENNTCPFATRKLFAQPFFGCSTLISEGVELRLRMGILVKAEKQVGWAPTFLEGNVCRLRKHGSAFSPGFACDLLYLSCLILQCQVQ